MDKEKEFVVHIPPGVHSGEAFNVRIGQRTIKVQCPDTHQGGMSLTIAVRPGSDKRWAAGKLATMGHFYGGGYHRFVRTRYKFRHSTGGDLGWLHNHDGQLDGFGEAAVVV